MYVPIGPSLSLAFHLADALGTIPAIVIKEVWDRYLSVDRFERRLQGFSQRGLIEAEPTANLEPVYRLTQAGLAEACGGRCPPVQLGREWDWVWRAAVWDIPELQASLRKDLRRVMKRAGFGHLQHSVWISPDPAEVLRQRIDKLRPEARNLTFLVMRPDAGCTDADLVAAAWNFPRIDRLYDQYLEVLRDRPRWHERQAWTRWLSVEWKAWKAAVGEDPLLPAILLPPGYRGQIAWEERCEVFRSLVTA